MNAIARIHMLKKAAALNDDSYRDLLERETGKRSSTELTNTERLAVINTLEALAPRRDSQRATGKFAKKLQALWIAGYNLDVIRDRSDRAMIAFLKRQTGLDHHRFLQDVEDAAKAIDALKQMIRREARNDDLFRREKERVPLLNDYRFQVCQYIWCELVCRGHTPADTLAEYLTKRTGRQEVYQLTAADWIVVQNALGKIYRNLK